MKFIPPQTPHGILLVGDDKESKSEILQEIFASRSQKHPTTFIFEENSHPKQIVKDAEALAEFVQHGDSFLIESNCFFVLKALYLQAQRHSLDIFLCEKNLGEDERWNNLRLGMPENSIVNLSIELHKEELYLTLR